MRQKSGMAKDEEENEDYFVENGIYINDLEFNGNCTKCPFSFQTNK